MKGYYSDLRTTVIILDRIIFSQRDDDDDARRCVVVEADNFGRWDCFENAGIFCLAIGPTVLLMMAESDAIKRVGAMIGTI